ncbi:MAG: histidinol-phosphatase [Chloroflexota bacterium]|nr:histidinol-phosphatase [Chloroflexota bacterium]
MTVLPGMELQTKEEVHVLCLFDTLDLLAELQILVNHTLPDVPNNIEFFGEQFIVDHTGKFIRRKKQLLINSTQLSIEEVEHAVHDLEGLFIPAHVNRQAFGLLYRLGFIPPELKVDALEISRHTTPTKFLKDYPQNKGYPLIQSGDVHFLADFMGVNQLKLHQPTIAELKKALKGENSCSIEIIKPI